MSKLSYSLIFSRQEEYRCRYSLKILTTISLPIVSDVSIFPFLDHTYFPAVARHKPPGWASPRSNHRHSLLLVLHRQATHYFQASYFRISQKYVLIVLNLIQYMAQKDNAGLTNLQLTFDILILVLCLKCSIQYVY